MAVCTICGATNPEGSRFCNACGARLAAAAETVPERSGERRVVTMLFCDVRGSTAMAETLDAEAWTDVMNSAYEFLIEPVVRHEGTVARLMGDAILAFFGAPTAHEDDPQRAVMAGLEIVSAISTFKERLRAERGLDLDVRVGINTGPVVVGQVGSDLRHEYTAMGDAVNVAARMEQTAEPGTVQITEDTYRLVADLFDVEDLGRIDVKGKREPVAAFRVRGRLAAPWRVRAVRSLEAPLVGRERELERVRSALESTGDGVGTALLLVGEPGIGKSRLVEEADAIWSRLEPQDERLWDNWSCVPYDAMQPYAQYRRLIRERAGIEERDPPEVARDKLAATIGAIAVEGYREHSERVSRALLGIELEDEEPLEGEAFQRAATELVVGSTIAQGGRRFIVFEDLHWCDRASLDLVRATTELVADHPYVVIATFRPDTTAASWDFKSWLELELGDRTEVLALEPLTSGESGRLIDELLPSAELPRKFRERILERTEGNPLFVQEVVRSLVDAGMLERSGDVLRLTDDVAVDAMPNTVQSLITVGLDRLPERARRTLQTAAVIGRTFEEEVLRWVTDEGDVRGDLRELERRDLIRAVAGSTCAFTFRHALTQEAAYASLLVRHRRELHHRVAEGIEAASPDRLDDVAALLVHHYQASGDDEATLRFALLAGDTARRLYANSEAAAHYRTAIDAGLRLGAGSEVLRAAFGKRGGTLEVAGRHQEAVAEYEEMRRIARERGDEAMELDANMAMALLYGTPSPLFDPDVGRRLSEDNAATARRLGDRAAEARALWNIVVSNIYGNGDDERAVEAGEASLAIARELGVREQIAFTLEDVKRADMSRGDFPTAWERLSEARGIWEELGNVPMLGENLTASSLMRLFRGEHATAMEEARRAFAISEKIDNRWGASYALVAVYRIELDLGRVGAAIPSIDGSRKLGEQGGFVYAAVESRAELAGVVAWAGDGERALALADEAYAIALEQIAPGVTIAAEARAEALLALGDLEGAREALAGIVPTKLPEIQRSFTVAAAGLTRSRLELASGDPVAATAAAEAVLERLRANGAEIFVAEALAELARARLAAGEPGDAERLVGESLERSSRLGERLARWSALEVLAEIRDRRGEADGAADARREIRTIADDVGGELDDDALRRGFEARAGRAGA
jgi:class 3 adenylate cyclase/tetratricopeptide (TPR) repeat protein